MSTTEVLTRSDPALAADGSPPPVRREAERRLELRRMKRRATGLLAVMSVLFVAVALLGDGEGLNGFLLAATEASMVGGLADWFAVTALFRHPLGIPIPHTAVIRERKDQFGETLGEFVQENFLSPEVLGARIRAARPVSRVAAWASEPANAERAARHAADLLVNLADVARDEDVQDLLHAQVVRAIESVPLAPLAGRGLTLMIADGRHQELVDAGLRNLEHALDQNQDVLRERFGQSAPWWLPDAFESRIFERLLDGARTLLRDVNSNPDHELRQRLDQSLADFADRLEHSPEMLERGEQLKRELLDNPELARWSSGLWTEVKVRLRTQAASPDSELRRRLADAIQAAGRRLAEDPELATKASELTEQVVASLAERFHDEITELVSGTISRWDGQQTSDRLELLLGRDLQFIRINGTVVGGLAGVAIHGLGEVLV